MSERGWNSPKTKARLSTEATLLLRSRGVDLPCDLERLSDKKKHSDRKRPLRKRRRRGRSRSAISPQSTANRKRGRKHRRRSGRAVPDSRAKERLVCSDNQSPSSAVQRPKRSLIDSSESGTLIVRPAPQGAPLLSRAMPCADIRHEGQRGSVIAEEPAGARLSQWGRRSL